MATRTANSVEAGTTPATIGRAAPENDRIALSVEDAARAASVGRTTIFMELRNGRLKGRKVGRRTVISVEDLNAWLTSLPTSRSIPEQTEQVHHLSREAANGRAR